MDRRRRRGVFLYPRANESDAGPSGDLITDFEVRAHIVDVSTVDADVTDGAPDAFAFIAAAAFSGTAGAPH